MVEEKSNKSRNVFVVLFILSLALYFVFPNTVIEVEEKEIDASLLSCSAFIPEPIVCEVAEEPIDYLAVAKLVAMEELVDDLDDDDLEVSFDRIYDVWSVEFDADEEGDYVVSFRARVELFNEEDYEDAEDDDLDYDAPLENYDFVVKYDASRDKFKVSY